MLLGQMHCIGKDFCEEVKILRAPSVVYINKRLVGNDCRLSNNGHLNRRVEHVRLIHCISEPKHSPQVAADDLFVIRNARTISSGRDNLKCDGRHFIVTRRMQMKV